MQHIQYPDRNEIQTLTVTEAAEFTSFITARRIKDTYKYIKH